MKRAASRTTDNRREYVNKLLLRRPDLSNLRLSANKQKPNKWHERVKKKNDAK
jgi:hypothetical protein